MDIQGRDRFWELISKSRKYNNKNTDFRVSQMGVLIVKIKSILGKLESRIDGSIFTDDLAIYNTKI